MTNCQSKLGSEVVGPSKVSLGGWNVASPPKGGKTTYENDQACAARERRGLIGRHLLHYLDAVVDAFQMRPVDEREQERMFGRWVSFIGEEGSIEATMKWFYASLFSQIGSQLLPPLGEVSDQPTLLKSLQFFYGGNSRVGRFMRMMILVNRDRLSNGGCLLKRRAMTIASTLANLKKGSPSPSETVVNATMVKNRCAMSDKSKHSEVTPFKGIVADVAIEKEIKKIVREVFSNRGTYRDACGLPSINGHVESGRGGSGAAGFLRGSLSYRLGNDLELMTYHPRLGVQEIRGTKVNPLLDDFMTKRRVYHAKPSFILEPLKVRTVTSGPALEYFVCKPIQQFMWSCLKDHPVFRLIGEPVSSEYLNEFFKTRISSSPNWLSGDYSAATDNLRRRFSQVAWNEVSSVCGFDEWARRLGSNCLVGHRITYPDGITIDQENGQLMGSPLSFPILCIVNAAICKLAYTLGGKWGNMSCKLRDCPILINGDDCVMDFDARQKQLWEGISAQAGLSPSIGKCYYSDGWLQINSENFLYVNGEFVTCPYVNFSLTSENKSRGEDIRHWTGLGAAAREFVYGFDEKEAARLLSIWIRRQAPLLKKAPRGISWWFPEHLGGLGLPILGTQEVLVSSTFPRLRDHVSKIPSGTNQSSRCRPFTGPLLDGEVRPVVVLENGPSMRLCTSQQAAMAYYLRDLMTLGQPAFKVGLPPVMPEWMNLGLCKARSFEVMYPQPEGRDWYTRKPTYDVKERPVNSSYNAFMWEALASDGSSKLVKPDLLLNTNKWYECFRLSRATICPTLSHKRFLDVGELLNYNPPLHCLPGGLERVYGRSINARPVRLHSQISAASTISQFGCGAAIAISQFENGRE